MELIEVERSGTECRRTLQHSSTFNADLTNSHDRKKNRLPERNRKLTEERGGR